MIGARRSKGKENTADGDEDMRASYTDGFKLEVSQHSLPYWRPSLCHLPTGYDSDHCLIIPVHGI